ncbi:hypothetical protein VN12_02605 [Pirellula sp. SH-Sr6A]|uniref:hypothetical protein n=1 Tax=Pirellula sp. SH-Sr6A TaxID=1632865 RepID=UPI00078C945F|nr:hypothetical protein [Pirellula sp. SH-Sr6A]AMV30978.1 hypothetical protein VN12_02605 [Pirellula sp. SH-Sr6A]
MSRKKSPPAPPHVDVPPRKPWTLGILIVAAGSFSTWYWYKPLPPDAGQAAYSNWDHTPSPDVWDEAELVRPALDVDTTLQGTGNTLSNASGELIPSARNGLLPVPSYKKNLGELAATEPIPSLPTIAPIGGDLSRDLSRPPEPWVSGKENRSGTGMLTSSPQPSRGTSQAGQWPDHAYEPPRLDMREERGAGIPSLLSSTIPTEPASIRTREESERRGGPETHSSRSGTLSVEAIREEAARKPMFIRQPKREE